MRVKEERRARAHGNDVGGNSRFAISTISHFIGNKKTRKRREKKLTKMLFRSSSQQQLICVSSEHYMPREFFFAYTS